MPDPAAWRCQFAATRRFARILIVVQPLQDPSPIGIAGEYDAGSAAEQLGFRRRRSRVWVAAGAAAVLIVVGFFVFTARRDSNTLKSGDQTTGQIIGEI